LYDIGQMEVAHRKVIQLCSAGVPVRKVANATHYSKTRVHEIYAAWRSRQNVEEHTLKQNHIDVLTEIQLVVDALLPWILDPVEMIAQGEIPPSKSVVGDYLKALDRKAKLLGTDAPKEPIAPVEGNGMVIDVEGEEISPQELAMKAIEALNALAHQPLRPEPYKPLTQLDLPGTPDPVEGEVVELEPEPEVEPEPERPTPPPPGAPPGGWEALIHGNGHGNSH
jgi:hypothetical protein